MLRCDNRPAGMPTPGEPLVGCMECWRVVESMWGTERLGVFGLLCGLGYLQERTFHSASVK